MEQGSGRDKYIILTERAQKLIEERINPIINMENAIFEEMKEKESQRLLQLTEKFLDILTTKSKKLD